MTSTTVVKAADAAQFLSFIPRLLGYHPTRSLVVIPFHGARSLGAMRFDLPGVGAEPVDRMAATVIGMACRLPDADAVAAIAYTDARFDDEERMPHRDLLDALERRADACGLHITDLLCVAADAWGSAVDATSPAAGRPLDELQPATRELADLPAPHGDQATGAELPECTPAEQEEVAAALVTLDRAVALLCGPEPAGRAGGSAAAHPATAAHPPSPARGSAVPPTLHHAAPASDDLAPVPAPVSGETEGVASVTGISQRIDPRALDAACRFDDLPGLFEAALDLSSSRGDAYDVATLIWCLARPSLRDVALVQWSSNLAQGDEALTAQLRWESGEEYPSHLAKRMWGDGDSPPPSRLERALDVARHAAAAAPREARPGALAMCAWLSWALGRSTHAAAYAERALEIEAEHGLSQIVLSFVHAGHLPGWAFQRDGAA